MAWKTEEMLDLNEESIIKVFTHCVWQEEMPKEEASSVAFLSQTGNHNVPAVLLHRKRLEEMKGTVAFLLGQLRVVHQRTDPFRLGDGFLKYDGTCWTKNRMALFCLYFLAVGTDLLPVFEPKESTAACLLGTQYTLKKTVSPNDPTFLGFCEELEYQEMLPGLVETKKKYFASPEYQKRKREALVWYALTNGEEAQADALSAQERWESFETDLEFLSLLSKKQAEDVRKTMKLYTVCE